MYKNHCRHATHHIPGSVFLYRLWVAAVVVVVAVGTEVRTLQRQDIVIAANIIQVEVAAAAVEVTEEVVEVAVAETTTVSASPITYVLSSTDAYLVSADTDVQARQIGKIAAITTTILQTTYTVTQTSTVLVPGRTVLETAYGTITETT